MSTITLKNHAVIGKQSKMTLKDRIVNYFIQNQNIITLGLCAASGKTPDRHMLRALKML